MHSYIYEVCQLKRRTLKQLKIVLLKDEFTPSLICSLKNRAEQCRLKQKYPNNMYINTKEFKTNLDIELSPT